MLTSSRSVSREITRVPPVVRSASSRLVPSKKASHPMPVQVFEGCEDQVRCVRFCPDEKKLVTGSSDKTIRILDRTTGAVEVLPGHSGWVQDVDVSQDGKLIVSGSEDKTIRIWNWELRETMHILEGHERWVDSVQFSPDASRVVSGSYDSTVRVWSVDTGELVFEPIKCHREVKCVRYSPSGNRIASGADSVQIWNADTGSGILSIRNSSVVSVAWTADGTHVIGGDLRSITIWNSHNGEQLRTWKAYDSGGFIRLSLSPKGTHLATSSWNEKTGFVFDFSSGEQIAALKVDVHAIAYSPSGKFIVTGCTDGKVYLWEAAVVEDPPAELCAPSFSSLLDRPAIQPAGPSRNDGRGFDAFWDSLPNRIQQAPPQPQHVFNKVMDTFTSLFSRRRAGATQTIPRGSVRGTVEPVEVAAGRDRVFWIVIERIVWTPVKTAIFIIFFCRKPGPHDGGGFAPINRRTTANPLRTQAGNATTNNQSARPKSDDAGNAAAGPNSSPTTSHDSCIRAQPKPTVDMSLSVAENTGAEPDSPATSAANNYQVHNQSECIEMVAVPVASTVSAHASSQHTPSTYPLSFSFTSCDPLSSTVPVSSAPLIVSSPEERALIEEYRRHKDKSVVVSMVAEPISDPAHDRDSYVHHEPSPSPSQSPGSVTPSVLSTQSPIYSQTRLHINVGLSPIIDPSSVLLSPSPLSAASRHPLSLHQPSTTGNLQSLNLTGSVGNTAVEACDSIRKVSPAPPTTAHEAGRQHAILHLQEQVERCRQKLDDAVAAMRKAEAEAERDGLVTGSPAAGHSSTQDGPSGGSKSITDPQVDHSAFTNVPSQGHPFSSTQSITNSIEGEEQANAKRKENTFSDQTNKVADSQHSVHPPHHREPKGDDASPAVDDADFRRALLQMQEQLDHLRRRFDDPKRKTVADGLDTGSPAVEAGPSSRN